MSSFWIIAMKHLTTSVIRLLLQQSVLFNVVIAKVLAKNYMNYAKRVPTQSRMLRYVL